MITKAVINKHFGQVPIGLLLDDSLSSGMKMIYCYLACKPAGWILNNENMRKTLKINKDTLSVALKTLMNRGWISRVERREQSIGRYDYTLYDITEELGLATNAQVKPQEKPQQQSLDIDDEETPTQENNIIGSPVVINITNINSQIVKKHSFGAQEVLAHLNGILKTNFSDKSKQTVMLITARIKDGYTLDDFKKVNTSKAKEWINNPEMTKYLTPNTLYAAKNFDKYINQAQMQGVSAPKAQSYNSQATMLEKVNLSSKIIDGLNAAGVAWQKRVYNNEALPEAFEIFKRDVGYTPDIEIKVGQKRTLFYFVDDKEVIDAEVIK